MARVYWKLGTKGRRSAGTRRHERLYSAAEVASALGASRMSVLRYIEDGRLPRPGLYLQLEGGRTWLWRAGEVDAAVRIFKNKGRRAAKS